MSGHFRMVGSAVGPARADCPVASSDDARRSAVLDHARSLGADLLPVGNEPRPVETLTYGYVALASTPLP
jgi:hypothetical protein